MEDVVKTIKPKFGTPGRFASLQRSI